MKIHFATLLSTLLAVASVEQVQGRFGQGLKKFFRGDRRGDRDGRRGDGGFLAAVRLAPILLDNFRQNLTCAADVDEEELICPLRRPFGRGRKGGRGGPRFFGEIDDLDDLDDLDMFDSDRFEGRMKNGTWACRTLHHPVTGEEYEQTVCVDPEKSFTSDECGCCGDCPAACECPCPEDADLVQILIAARDEDGNDIEVAKCAPAGFIPIGDRVSCAVC